MSTPPDQIAINEMNLAKTSVAKQLVAQLIIMDQPTMDLQRGLFEAMSELESIMQERSEQQ